MNLNYLESIRLLELECVLAEMEKIKLGEHIILEIGAGTGWQSKKLAEKGYSVESIDIDSSGYLKNRVWPITNYDGKHIPFPDNYFDVIFSSNVLEHIYHVVSFQGEMQRVLKPGGTAIHVVPSGSWRFWTSLAHYPFVVKTIKKIITKKLVPSKNGSISDEEKIVKKINQLSKFELIRKVAFPSRHGEIGNEITELYYFSRYRWFKMFTTTDWKIEKMFTNRLFYTGYTTFGYVLSLKLRRYLSYILGSSCHVFVLRKG